MNFEQVTSIVRQIMLIIGGSLVTKGVIDSGTLQTIVGAVIALASSGWAIYTRRTNGLIASAAAQPEVGKIVTTPTVADAVPNSKVVSQ